MSFGHRKINAIVFRKQLYFSKHTSYTELAI